MDKDRDYLAQEVTLYYRFTCRERPVHSTSRTRVPGWPVEPEVFWAFCAVLHHFTSSERADDSDTVVVH